MLLFIILLIILYLTNSMEEVIYSFHFSVLFIIDRQRCLLFPDIELKTFK